MRLLALLAAVAPALAACTIEQRTDRALADAPEPSASEFLRPWGDSTPPAGVKSGDLVWIWAMAGTVPGTAPPSLVEGGVEAETRQAIANVVSVLQLAGATPRDVAQCSVFLADSADLDAMQRVYGGSFPAPPRRVAMVTAGLAMGARVEIECTAVLTSTP
jgi:enamine deaminase RidA (YjgF/YER057c/UK114 family)